MNIVAVWLLVLNTYTGVGDAATSVAPQAFPEWKDCERVRRLSESKVSHCVKTRIMVTK